MASKRKAIKARTKWDDQTPLWATHAGRVLALDLYHGRHAVTRPYGVGVVLDCDQTAWSEVPVRFNEDWPAPLGAGQRVVMPAIRPCWSRRGDSSADSQLRPPRMMWRGSH